MFAFGKNKELKIRLNEYLSELEKSMDQFKQAIEHLMAKGVDEIIDGAFVEVGIGDDKVHAIGLYGTLDLAQVPGIENVSHGFFLYG